MFLFVRFSFRQFFTVKMKYTLMYLRNHTLGPEYFRRAATSSPPPRLRARGYGYG